MPHQAASAIRPGKPHERCFLQIYCYQGVQLQTSPAPTRAAGKGLGFSGESTTNALCGTGLPSFSLRTASRKKIIIAE